MTSRGTSNIQLREEISEDICESQALQAQIDQLRQDIAHGKIHFTTTMPQGAETNVRQTSKDLARRIDEIENKGVKDAIDREFLQTLNARQIVWDRQIMQVREMTDLMFEGRECAMNDKAAVNSAQKKEETASAQPDEKSDFQQTVVPESAEETWQENPSQAAHIDNLGADADGDAEAPSGFVFAKEKEQEDGGAANAKWTANVTLS